MEKLVVASNNPGKIEEIKSVLKDFYDVVSMREAGITQSPEETGETFEENAVIKAQALFETLGCPALSDDSGLCVFALGGAPGVYSARYAGPECDDLKNNAKLLEKMKNATDRRAEFISCVCLYRGKNDVLTAYGSAKGEILKVEIGKGGFGYDPLFYSYDLKKSFAEATAEEKNSISHRAQALNRLLAMLKR